MVCPQALVLVFVWLLRIAGQPCPSSDRLLLFLFRMNPFTLDQCIDGWCRSGLGSLERFVLQVRSIRIDLGVIGPVYLLTCLCYQLLAEHNWLTAHGRA